MKRTAGARAPSLARSSLDFFLALTVMAGVLAMGCVTADDARAAEPPPPQSRYFFRPGMMVKTSGGFTCASEAAFRKANDYKYGGEKAKFDAMFASRDCTAIGAGAQYKIVAIRDIAMQLAPAAGSNVWSDPYFFEPAGS